MSKKQKVYLVKMEDGELKTLDNWPDCQSIVIGTSLKFVSGASYGEALKKLMAMRPGGTARKKKESIKEKPANLPTEGLCSDGAASGNPGPAEYQVADLNGNILVHRKLGIRSNNYAELAGIGAMIKYVLVSRETNILWTDSKIAIGWAQTLRIGQTVRDRPIIVKMARAIHAMLRQHPEIQLKKWDTKNWGEIPADFGRK